MDHADEPSDAAGAPADERPGDDPREDEDAPAGGGADLVVGLGASAGGLQPLTELFDSLDDGSRAAYVVVQHLDPDRSSTIPEILQRHTSLSVRAAEDGAPLRPGHVYVNPPDSQVGVEDGALRLASPHREPGRPTIIDHFFRSLAAEAGGRSVAIVLSGTGSDGTLGVTRVREAGGLTMAQEPESAEFPDMPESAIATGNVDVVLPPSELAPYLASYARRRAGTSVQDESEAGAEELLEEILDLLKRHVAVDFTMYKESTLLRRIERRFLMSDAGELGEYVDLLRREPGEVVRLHDDLLIGVTSFFRNPDAFRSLREEVLRKLTGGATEGQTIRIWVPACGTGQEAYSVAMLLSECLAEADREPNVKIFGTDLDEDALDRARKGHYPRGIREEVPDVLLNRYFDEAATGYRVDPEIRRMILFSKQNVLSDPPFSELDLICCRNLAIYLKTEAQGDLFRIFHFALRSGGYLFLGGTENLGQRSDLFRTVDEAHRIFQRRDVSTRTPLPISVATPSTSVSAESRFGVSRPVRDESGSGGFERRLERELLDQLAPTCVVVDRNQEVLYFHGRTSTYLEHPPGAPSHDLLEMARPGLRSVLGRAVRHVMQTGEAVSRQGIPIEDEGPGGEARAVDVLVRPLSAEERLEDLFLVVFRGSVAPDVPSPDFDERELDDEVPAGVVEELERELRDTRDRLQATIAEVESSNEELRSMNEELQTANEELQTSREEARAANEELQTVNEELQTKIAELRRAHSDLENLLRSTQIATVFVDREMRIEKFTPAATSIFRLEERDRGRALEDITTRLEDGEIPNLIGEMEQVMETLRPREREVRLPEDDEWYTMRIMPYRTVEDRIEGVVLTFTDVTKLKKLQKARSKLIAVMEGMPDAIIGRDRSGTITSWNMGARRIFGYTEEEALGQDIDLIVPEDRREEMERYHRVAAEGAWSEPVETVRVRKDGTPVHVSVNYSCVHDETGEVTEIAGIARDITERVEAQEEVERANRRQTEFMAMLSHELRNPLAPMRHAIDLLQREDVRDPDRRRRAREILDRQVGYLSRLVDDLTDIARISSGSPDLKLTTVDLAEVVRDTVTDYGSIAEEKEVRLVADLPEEGVPVRGDGARLAQVLGNLLDNACTYTPADGHVRVRLTAGRESAVMAVEDEGPGLDGEQIESVFEPFHQGREQGDHAGDGLGLGLTVARRLVEMHGGTLTAGRGDGRGSTFRMELPLPGTDADAHRTETAVEDATEPADGQAPRRSGGDGEEPEGGEPEEGAPVETGPDGEAPIEAAERVLVVEDYRDAAETMAMTLQSLGREVEIAGDAEEAIRRAREFRPAVVLCDIGLPGGRDGYDLARSLRSEPELAGIRLVAVTGFGTDLDRERAEEAGFDQHLTKPIDSEALLRAVGG